MNGDAEDLDLRFNHHPPNSEAANYHVAIRKDFRELAGVVVAFVPEGRERSLALTKLEEAAFWSHAGIARGISAVAPPQDEDFAACPMPVLTPGDPGRSCTRPRGHDGPCV